MAGFLRLSFVTHSLWLLFSCGEGFAISSTNIAVEMSRQNPETVEQAFFTALIEADADRLDELLANDFLLIDVMTGSEVSKAALLETVRAGLLRFDEINRIECRVRRYGVTAVITGRTRMRGAFDGQPFCADSRYTHVLVSEGEHWRLVTAQGTPITPASGELK